MQVGNQYLLIHICKWATAIDIIQSSLENGGTFVISISTTTIYLPTDTADTSQNFTVEYTRARETTRKT